MNGSRLRRPLWSVVGVAAAVLMVLVAAGCGGGDGTPAYPEADAAAPPRDRAVDEAEIRSVVERFYRAFIAPDAAEACSLMTAAARSRIVEDPESARYGDTCEEVIAGASALVRAFSGGEPEFEVTRVDVTGDTARATTRFGGGPESVNLERAGGTWRIGPDDDEAAGGGEDVDRETADGWAQRWCRLEVGMTRAEVQAIMGSPTSTHTGAESQDEFDAYQWSFTAFYRSRTDISDASDEPVYLLQANDTELTAADRARIGCPLVRD